MPKTQPKKPALRGKLKTASGDLPFYHSQASGKNKPVYPHSPPSEFVIFDDLDLFEYSLRHQSAVDNYSQAVAQQGVFASSFVESSGKSSCGSNEDSARRLRLSVQRHQEAFQRLLNLNEQIRDKRRRFGDAKGAQLAGDLYLLSAEELAKRSEGERKSAIQMLSRRHSLASASAAIEMVRVMHTAASHDLRRATEALQEQIAAVRSNVFRRALMNNCLCALQLLENSDELVRFNEPIERQGVFPGIENLIEDQFKLR